MVYVGEQFRQSIQGNLQSKYVQTNLQVRKQLNILIKKVTDHVIHYNICKPMKFYNNDHTKVRLGTMPRLCLRPSRERWVSSSETDSIGYRKANS